MASYTLWYRETFTFKSPSVNHLLRARNFLVKGFLSEKKTEIFLMIWLNRSVIQILQYGALWWTVHELIFNYLHKKIWLFYYQKKMFTLILFSTRSNCKKTACVHRLGNQTLGLKRGWNKRKTNILSKVLFLKKNRHFGSFWNSWLLVW